MLAVYIFAASLITLVLFLLFMHVEQRRNKRFFAGLRLRFDSFIERVLDRRVSSLGHLPRKSRHLSRAILVHLIHEGSIAMLRVLKFIERRLIRVVHMVRGKGVIDKRGSTSLFLQKVYEHKHEGGMR